LNTTTAIIAHTTQDCPHDFIVKHGLDGHLPKPFTHDRLVHIINTYIHGQQ